MQTLRRPIFAALASASALSAQADRPDPSASPPGVPMDRIVAKIMEEKRIPGAVVGVLRGKRLTYRKAFGVKDAKLGTPMTTDTLFQVGSVTKTLTATLYAMLVSNGRIDPEESIAHYLPARVELPKPLEGLAVGQLATHTSGLPRNPVNRRDLPDSPGVMLPYSVEELYTGLGETELLRAPGREWSYSNLGYGLLGHIVERAAAKPYEELLSLSLLRPLGMVDTGIEPTPEQERRFASHHWIRDNPRVPRPRWKIGQIVGFAGVFSSVSDLAKFASVHLGARKLAGLSTAALATMHRPVITIDKRAGQSMTPGWFVQRLPGGLSVIGHGGEVDGHSATLSFFPGHGLAFIVLTNLGGDAAESIARAALPDLMGSLMKKAP